VYKVRLREVEAILIGKRITNIFKIAFNIALIGV
jgi:hypothetical protein